MFPSYLEENSSNLVNWNKFLFPLGVRDIEVQLCIQWKADHISCKANFKGSAPAIEQEGAFRIFQRSKEERNLRYSGLLSDGNSKMVIM